MMMKFSTIAILAGALALSACNNPDRFGAGGAGGAGGGGAGGIGVGGLGDPSDPNSPAYFAQTIGDTVRFDVDQHTLRPESQTVLAQQAQWLNQHPTYTALIEGHADEQGTLAYNIALGDRRANEVKRFLAPLQPAGMSELVLTGGGMFVPALREAVLAAAGDGFKKVHGPALKKQTGGTPVDKLDPRFTRGGSAVGGVGLYFEREFA